MTMLRFRWLAALLLLLCGSAALAAEPLLDKLLRLAGLTATPAQMKTPGDEMDAGDIWLVTPGGTPEPLTSDGGYRSPVFSPADGSLLALKGGSVVRLQGAGRVELVAAAPGVLKLVGMDANSPDELVVLAGTAAPLGVLSLKDGKLAPLLFDSKSEVHQRMLAQVRGQERTYGATRLYVKTESKRGLSRTLEWTDVYLRRDGGTPQNVSTCDGANCGEPALSPDGKRVAFVKSGG
jgi:hypothetical protein